MGTGPRETNHKSCLRLKWVRLITLKASRKGFPQVARDFPKSCPLKRKLLKKVQSCCLSGQLLKCYFKKNQNEECFCVALSFIWSDAIVQQKEISKHFCAIFWRNRPC